MYNREEIDKVRSAIDIVEVVREYVPSLKASGRSVKGLCPFHHEKTPSFHVHADKGIFKCFGCGEAGDVIQFVSKLEGSGFAETLEQLAGKAGIVLKKSYTPREKEEESVREKVMRVLDAALRFYEAQLWDNRVGAPGRAYLKERAITDDTAKDFRLGMAPFGGDSVFETCIKKGFTVDLCQQAGLVSRSASGRYYDPLFGRLIFPIFDNFGHVVGFGGRVLPKAKKSVFGDDSSKRDSEPPKYINSPETPVFSKGKLLYGLGQGKSAIMAGRRALILEGYMDVIGAHQGGFQYAVATLGTAFTRDHAKLLKRYSEEIVAFFDPDEAGRKAALRGLEPMLQENLFPKMVLVEGSLDPDEYILKHGQEAFQALVEKAPDFVDYILRTSSMGKDLNLQEKTRLAQQLLTLIKQSSNEILKGEWIAKVSKTLGLQAQSLETEMKKMGRVPPRVVERPVLRKPAPRSRIPSAEEELLQLICHSQETWNDLDFDGVPFIEEKHKKLFSLVQDQLKKTGVLSIPSLLGDLPADVREWFLNLTMEERIFADPIDRRDQLIRDIRIKRDRERLAALSQKLAQGQVNQDERAEFMTLLRRVKGSSRAGVSSSTAAE